MYTVNIVGLSANKAHTFDFSIGDEFFRQYGTELLPGGEFEAKVVLDKHETFIDADFTITGKAKLVCDRSLDQFDEPVKVHRKVMFKYGDEPRELTDEIIVIAHDEHKLDLGQLMYEFISLEIPMKKLHPRFRKEDKDDDAEGRIVYKSGPDENEKENDIDPRWEKLKKLK